MAARSPSPNPSRPKTPEISSSLRKSKEIPQRSSLSKPASPSPRASFEQKENVRSRSPAVSSSKGSKNFMAPTISAASKAVAASPRKKILQERNEVINSSSDSIEIQEVGSKSEMGFGSREVSGSCELRKGEPRIKNHQNLVVPSFSVSPLPDPPSLPPYDPKTNFLSPRPQFLHYRPNPRIEQYLNGEGELLDLEDGRRLEDTFSSESGEDDDVTVLTEEKEKESEEESFHSEAEEVEEVESPSETLVTPPELKPETPLKRRPFRRSKLVPFLLLLLVACLYAPVSDSPIVSSPIVPEFYAPSFQVFEDSRLGVYLAVANGSLHGLASKFKHWSADSIAYFTSVTSPPKDSVGLYRLANVTSSVVEQTAGLGLSYAPERETKQAIKESLVEEMSVTVHESEVPEVVEVTSNQETDMVVFENGNEGEIDARRIATDVSGDVLDAGSMADLRDGSDKIELLVPEDCEDAMDADSASNEVGRIVELEQEASPIGYEAEVNAEIVPESETIGDEGDSSRDIDAIDRAQSASSIYNQLHSLELTKSFMFGLSLALVLLPAAVAFLYTKQKQAPMVEKERQATKKVGSVSDSSKTCIHLRGNEEMIDDVYPETSSISNSTSSSGRRLASSSERRPRRDSTASSVSYGSFTTYERLSAKKGCKDEEVVTPVRRSSRIRNLVTSP